MTVEKEKAKKELKPAPKKKIEKKDLKEKKPISK